MKTPSQIKAMKKESKKSAKKEQYKTRRIKFETGWLIITYKVTE